MELVLDRQIISKYHVAEDVQSIEIKWIEEAKTDRAKFAPLYQKYYEQIFRFIYQRVDDKDIACDIASQVFLKAMMNLNKYEYKGVPFSSWLYRIARNEMYDLFKSNKVNRAVNINSASVNNIIDEIEVDHFEEYNEKIKKAISELPEEELQLIEMRFFEKRSFKEIGEILVITENNAKVKLYRVLHKLKNRIK